MRAMVIDWQTDGQTDMDKLVVTFPSFENTPKIFSIRLESKPYGSH